MSLIQRLRQYLAPEAWYARVLLHGLCALPAAGLVFSLFAGGLGPDPAKELLLETGEWALRWLLLCLTISPLRQWTGSKGLLLWRRPLGLWAAAWAGVHLTLFAVFYVELNFALLLEETLEHPYITAGFTAVLLMLPLVLTSNRAAMRAMGRSWQKLHRLVYASALLAVIHLVWQLREEWGEAAFYSLWLAVLLGFRLWRARAKARAKA